MNNNFSLEQANSSRLKEPRNQKKLDAKPQALTQANKTANAELRRMFDADAQRFRENEAAAASVLQKSRPEKSSTSGLLGKIASSSTGTQTGAVSGAR